MGLYSAPSFPQKPGSDGADTHTGLVSESEWPETQRWKRLEGFWPAAAGPGMQGAERPPWLRRRQAGEDKRATGSRGGSEALLRRLAASCPAPGREKQKTRGPANSEPE